MLLADQQGSIRLLTSTAGREVGAISYGPYGNVTGRTGTVTSDLGYDGQYTDPATGYIYLRARYYDPQTGQFLTRDPEVSLTGAPYSYAGDDPVNGSDPTGLSWWNPFSWTLHDWLTGGIIVGLSILTAVTDGADLPLAGAEFGLAEGAADVAEGAAVDATSELAADAADVSEQAALADGSGGGDLLESQSDSAGAVMGGSGGPEPPLWGRAIEAISVAGTAIWGVVSDDPAGTASAAKDTVDTVKTCRSRQQSDADCAVSAANTAGDYADLYEPPDE
jgi:RHS repeat-associated protein